MKGWIAGIIGWVVGATCGVGGVLYAHHGRPYVHHEAQRAAATAGPDARPAFLVVLGEVHDREQFMSGYTAKLPPLYGKFGGEYLAAGRNFEVLEGTGTFRSYVISKWPSMEAVKAFWTSPEYDALRRARIDGNWGRFDVYALEGLPAPQPAQQDAAHGGGDPTH